jgi:uncharacterized delta-60 repeat protein
VSCSSALAAPGSLDPTFGGDGRVTFDSGLQEQAPAAVAVELDGQIVAAVRSYDGVSPMSCTLVRYDSTGVLDPTLDSDGANVWCTEVAVQGDGKIVVVGGSSVACFNADGTLDTSFSGDGIARLSVRFDFEVYAVAIQPNGKIVAVGTNFGECACGIALIVRFNADGTIDRSFAVGPGPDGVRELGRWGGDARAVSIQPNGKILVAGNDWTDRRGRQAFALYRLLPNGADDSSFGGDGTVVTQWRGDWSVAEDVVRQADGKIVAAGYSGEWSDYDFALTRYTRGGRLDTTFSDDGKKRTDFHGGLDEAHALAIQPNGRIVVAGKAAPPDRRRKANFGLARYRANGELDSTFSRNGKQRTRFGPNHRDYGTDLALQANGRIIIAGVVTAVPGEADLGLA